MYIYVYIYKHIYTDDLHFIYIYPCLFVYRYVGVCMKGDHRFICISVYLWFVYIHICMSVCVLYAPNRWAGLMGVGTYVVESHFSSLSS